jgi:hypothetical protein
MSMTQTALLERRNIPSGSTIEEKISELGYNFKILNKSEDLFNQKGLSCTINNHETYFEIIFEEATEFIKNNSWINQEKKKMDTAISFVWGADFAAGACIGLISIILIDSSNAKIYYLDDQMEYTREMLLDDTPLFLNELKKKK